MSVKKGIRIRIPAAIAPEVIDAIDREVGNRRALAASFQVCAENSQEPFFKAAAEAELVIARKLEAVSVQIFKQQEGKR